MIVETGTLLFYRSVAPLDEGAIWMACASRSPRPSYERCRTLLSEQLTRDEASDNYLDASAGAIRQLLAMAGTDPVGLLSLEVNAGGDAVLVVVDPIGFEHVGEMERDAWTWAEQTGLHDDITVVVVSGAVAEMLPPRPLTFDQ